MWPGGGTPEVLVTPESAKLNANIFRDISEVAKVMVTLALAIFSAVGPSRRRHEAQLATEHVGVRD